MKAPTQMTTVEDSTKLGPGQRALIVIGIAAVVGIAVWLLTGKDNDSTSSTFAADGSSNARVVSEGDLASIPDQMEHPVFWAGKRADTDFEVSNDATGNVHLRYLPAGSSAGAQGNYLDIGSYPFTGAYDATKQLAKQSGVIKVKAAGNAIGFVQKNNPYSVILSYPSHPDLQVEVYNPQKNAALTVVKQGDIVALP